MTAPAPPPRPEGHKLLQGKTVLITAAAGTGIGFSVAERAVDEGARVMISDIHEGRLSAAAEKLVKKSGDTVPTQLCDVTKEEEVGALVEAAIKTLGHVDVLVNNAGLGGTADVVDMTDE
jgi:3-oxoacyl-[acyl-carrier protein] reductase